MNTHMQDATKFLRATVAEVFPEICRECGEYPPDLPSTLCQGCAAYQTHTGE